jgi:hypothetical protein
MHSLLRISGFIASSLTWILFVTAAAVGESNVAGRNIMDVSRIAIGDVQEVGFHAMIQQRADEVIIECESQRIICPAERGLQRSQCSPGHPSADISPIHMTSSLT